jgi:hypothetical protein
MSPEELTLLGKRLVGERHWKARLARFTGLDKSTVTRLARGDYPVPMPTAFMIRTLYARQKARNAEARALGVSP